jgi:hypothetical protein
MFTLSLLDTHRIGDTVGCFINGVPARVHWSDAEHLVIEPGAVEKIISWANERPVLVHLRDGEHPDSVQKIVRVDHVDDRIHFFCVGLRGTFPADYPWNGFEVPPDQWDEFERRMNELLRQPIRALLSSRRGTRQISGVALVAQQMRTRRATISAILSSPDFERGLNDKRNGVAFDWRIDSWAYERRASFRRHRPHQHAAADRLEA